MSDKKPFLIATDLEGVFIPEIWHAVHQKTGIDKLKLTTRDISDYDELMSIRLDVISKNNLKLGDIQKVIAELNPLPGAEDFIKWAESVCPLIILSDTFYEFAGPLMAKLGFPTLFCHNILADSGGAITGYKLRSTDGKRKAVASFKQIGFRVIAMGDSYNDTAMLKEADFGIFFRPPENVVKEFPQFPVFEDYRKLREHIQKIFSEN